MIDHENALRGPFKATQNNVTSSHEQLRYQGNAELRH
jgi:hypothetical protein